MTAVHRFVGQTVLAQCVHEMHFHQRLRGYPSLHAAQLKTTTMSMFNGLKLGNSKDQIPAEYTEPDRGHGT